MPQMTKPDVFKFPAFFEEPMGDAPQATWDWLNHQGNQVRFDALVAGDRFLTTDSLWTKLDSGAARKHSSESRALGNKGHGYMGDSVCSFDADDIVAFVPPTV